MELTPHLQTFFTEVASGRVEVYNEFSLQHELGIHLRAIFATAFKIQFERNVSCFPSPYTPQLKKEIDICAFRPDKAERYAIELKFPMNGQYPEQMFSACKDIAFLEELVRSGFRMGWFVILADDRLFYEGQDHTGIYAFFRASEVLTGTVQKPTGNRDQLLNLTGRYVLKWNPLRGVSKWAFVEVPPGPA